MTYDPVAHNNPVYYKVMLHPDLGIIVPCMQWFDEYDYPEDKGYVRLFDDREFESEEAAVAAMREVLIMADVLEKNMSNRYYNAARLGHPLSRRP